jgi:hypothetical protein
LFDQIQAGDAGRPAAIVEEIRGADLLLCGKQDAPIQFGNSFDCMKAVPRVTLISRPRTGHLPRDEASAQAATSVLGLLPDRRSRGLIRRTLNPYCY